MRSSCWIGLLILGVSNPILAAEEPEGTIDFELFRPASDAYGYMHVPSAATLGHLQMGAGFWVNYQNDPIILVHQDARTPPSTAKVSRDNGEALVDDRITSNVQLGLGMSRYFSLSLDMPLVLWQDGYQLTNLNNPTTPPDTLISAGLGDIRIQPKVVAIDRDRMPIGLAVQIPVSLPTGNGGSFLGEEGFAMNPSVVVEFSDGPIRSRQYTFRSAVQLGYQVRPPDQLLGVDMTNAFSYGIGMGLHPTDILEIMGEFHGEVWGNLAAQNSAEALSGIKFLIGDYVNINLGGGFGVLQGIGSPDYRLLGGISVAPNFDPNSRDSDKDGIVNGMDRCPRDPEDRDKFQDDDGCPDLDNDKDGIPDKQDQCPNDAEDDDGWRDNDGCPDSDNDKDGILDVADRCPNEAETSNGYMDDDGCPDDAPVDDTDGDGYSDDVDRCPYDAEDFDGVDDEDGCPDTRVSIENDYIKITEKLYFEFGRAVIQERSYSLLDEIAATVSSNAHLKKIRIEGHTDSVGSDEANRRLSKSRAQSVQEALESRGVDKSRLAAVGFGEDQPIETNKTEEGRAANRRVEFIIIDQDLHTPQ